MGRVAAAAALPLSGISGEFGRDAAAGLSAWARWRGARLAIVDTGDDPLRCAREVARLGPRCDLLFGPYGSGLTRAAVGAAGACVLWNHGGAAVPREGERVVDILGPAERYWDGLGEVLDPSDAPVALLVGASPFARAVAVGARHSLRLAGLAFTERPIDPGAVDAVLAGGARTIIGCGRPDEDAALGRALLGSPVRVALVLCGVDRALTDLGPGIGGWLGPAQWDGRPPPLPLPRRAQYPAAQALAAALVADAALERAGTSEPEALWDAARELRMRTFLGPFAVDREGRQVAHAPVLMRWEGDPIRRAVAWRPPGGDP